MLSEEDARKNLELFLGRDVDPNDPPNKEGEKSDE